MTQDLCQHHWLIEPPGGEFSQGICRLCGESRLFRNSSPWVYTNRQDDILLSKTPLGPSFLKKAYQE